MVERSIMERYSAKKEDQKKVIMARKASKNPKAGKKEGQMGMEVMDIEEMPMMDTDTMPEGVDEVMGEVELEGNGEGIAVSFKLTGVDIDEAKKLMKDLFYEIDDSDISYEALEVGGEMLDMECEEGAEEGSCKYEGGMDEETNEDEDGDGDEEEMEEEE